MSTMDGVIVFGGDRVHAADTARCEALSGAAVALGASPCGVPLLVGRDGADGPGARQDAVAALRQIQAWQARRPGAVLLFSATDAFSAHMARLWCASSGAALVSTVVALREHQASCVDHRGVVRRHALSPGQVLLVDERYFQRVAVDAERVDTSPCHAAGGGSAYDDFEVAADAVPLPDAAFVLSGGDGVSDWDSFLEAARLLGATIGASKVVCDKGLLPRDRQVGSSGTAVAPRVYVALGISGSTQHLQGVADTARILAVNTDPNATMVRRAELALITDADALLRALCAALKGEEVLP